MQAGWLGGLLPGSLAGWLGGWLLVGWLAGFLAGLLFVCVTGWVFGLLAGCLPCDSEHSPQDGAIRVPGGPRGEWRLHMLIVFNLLPISKSHGVFTVCFG